MITYRQKHQLKIQSKKTQKDKVLVNMDYLIMNLEGTPFGEFEAKSDFKSHSYEYGSRTFKNRADIIYKDIKLGTLLSCPHSSVISEDLAQFQLENNLFYTIPENQLKEILLQFCDETNYKFKSVNRLDVCLDKNDSKATYRKLYSDVVGGAYLISGRTKAINSYYETYKGKSVLNGFQIGKRTSEKLIRCYNKTLSLQLTEKPYINDWYQQNGLKNDEVWRFEYQLNSRFFRDLKEFSKADEATTELMTWGIFKKENLIELVKIANKGFFEIRENTGLSQINKEKIALELFDFEQLQKNITSYPPIIKRVKRAILSSTTIKKRLVKSLFREYYSNNQDISYIVAMNLVLEEIDLTTNKPLINWFNSKLHFYLHEFRLKEKIVQVFDFDLFNEHKLLFL
ncbi:hypothetical protein [Flavobacterium daejeonense]|uniref:hypothetical protein n=1 Tax=Flavobacterium daejeonense TaxID=350893 RepID=UPI00047E1F19|nr:hypothetical protein [Flavobacterium daejeonense]